MEKYKSRAAQARNSTTAVDATRSSTSLRSGEQIGLLENGNGGPTGDGSDAVVNVALVKQRLTALFAQLVLHHRLALPVPHRLRSVMSNW